MVYLQKVTNLFLNRPFDLYSFFSMELEKQSVTKSIPTTRINNNLSGSFPLNTWILHLKYPYCLNFFRITRRKINKKGVYFCPFNTVRVTTNILPSNNILGTVESQRLNKIRFTRSEYFSFTVFCLEKLT